MVFALAGKAALRHDVHFHIFFVSVERFHGHVGALRRNRQNAVRTVRTDLFDIDLPEARDSDEIQ